MSSTWTVVPRSSAVIRPHGQCFDVLDREERARADAFRTPELREQYVAAHAMVRTVLSTYASVTPSGWRYTYGSKGQPRLVDAPVDLRFSLSHSGARAAVAVTVGHEVGFDLEEVDPAKDRARDRGSVLHPGRGRCAPGVPRSRPLHALRHALDGEGGGAEGARRRSRLRPRHCRDRARRCGKCALRHRAGGSVERPGMGARAGAPRCRRRSRRRAGPGPDLPDRPAGSSPTRRRARSTGATRS